VAYVCSDVLRQLAQNFTVLYFKILTPVAARSKAWVCGHSLAGIAGSNPDGDMDVCLL